MSGKNVRDEVLELHINREAIVVFPAAETTISIVFEQILIGKSTKLKLTPASI